MKYFAGDRVKARSSFSGGERDHLFLSEHGQQFVDLAGLSGLDAPGDGRSFVIWDYDRDGWSDVAVASSNRPWLALYHNELGAWPAGELASHEEATNFVAIRFHGGNQSDGADSRWAPRDGAGALVEFEVGPARLVREYRLGEGLAAQNSGTLLIGLGTAERAERLTVRWPSGRVQVLAPVAAGELIDVWEDATRSPDGSGFSRERYLGSPGPASTAQRLDP